eukprot:CAMPEP_0185851806 /NCGR_PEP_ID=MMETSP1354-20130828/11754_1 /TAXON_ID=708628 /ORGANISM="Erythrolobus madagascarensis, Strain CCMP3276" /LENGTH=261 /DNA_ID=CAMNT_0028552879 /DNA_START=93 /DNA_END=878 /DNA_ORIENTATION=+
MSALMGFVGVGCGGNGNKGLLVSGRAEQQRLQPARGRKQRGVTTVMMMGPRKLQVETRVGTSPAVTTTTTDPLSSANTRRATITAALGGVAVLLAKRLVAAAAPPQERILTLAMLMGLPAAARACVNKVSHCVETLRAAPKSVSIGDAELSQYSHRCWWTSILSVAALYVAALSNVAVGAAVFTLAQLWHAVRSRVTVESGQLFEVCRFQRSELVTGGSLCTGFAALSVAMPTMAVLFATCFLTVFVFYGLSHFQAYNIAA